MFQKFTLSCVALCLGMATSARADRYVMGVLGDSISAATFADKSVKLRGEPDDILEDGVDMRVPFLGNMENKELLSWASGKNVGSHFLRLSKSLQAAEPDAELDVLNLSVPGEKAAGLIEQAKAFLEGVESGEYKSVKYVTLLIGANDVCDKNAQGGTPTAQMTNELSDAIDLLSSIRQEEPLRVLVVGIPNIPDLGRTEILKTKTVLGLTCKSLRQDIVGSCNSMTVWKTQEEYEARVGLVKEKNASMANAVTELSQKHSRALFQYTDKFFETEIDPSWLAADCFHPNKTGQAELSKRLWEVQPWF